MAWASGGAMPPLAFTSASMASGASVTSDRLAVASFATAFSNAGPTVLSTLSSARPFTRPSRAPESATDASGSGAMPAITASASAQSATPVASGPIESSE